MSALAFSISKSKIVIAMDTLVSVDEGATIRPSRYTTKMYLLPYINCVICGIGSSIAVETWYEFVRNEVIAYGITSLDKTTQKHLQRIVDDKCKRRDNKIYQFGVCEYDGTMQGYVYNSFEGYRGKQFEYNKIYTNPHLPEDCIVKGDDLFQNFNDILKNLRKAEDIRGGLDKISIGGMVQILVMEKDKMFITNYDKFDDYDYCLAQINENITDYTY